MKLIKLLSAGLLLTGASLAHAQWTIQMVDTGAGSYPCIQLDRRGNPHVGYSGNAIEKYARWDGSAWRIQTVDSSAEFPGGWGSLSLDTMDRPHLAYLQGTRDPGVLRYAYWNGSQWVRATVDTNDDLYDAANIVVDKLGGVHFACHWTSGPYMKYMYWNGSQWWKQIADSTSSGDASGLALDTLRRPHLSCFSYLNGGDPLYCFWDGSRWVKRSHNDPSPSGAISSIALDRAGTPHILYVVSPNPYRTKYMRWNGADWDTSTIADSAVCGTSGLVLDGTGRPHVAYGVWMGGSRYRVEYAWRSGSSWVKEVVDTVGWYMPSLAMDSAGRIWVAYSDWGQLKVAYRLPSATEREPTAPPFRHKELTYKGKTVSFSLSKPTWTELTAYDILGRKTSTLYQGWASSGETKVAFPARLRSGVYFLRLTTGEGSLTRKMVWLR
jgi:hypothetical protein